MHGSKGIRKPKRPGPLNIAEPLVHPQESATMRKNRSEAMKTYWTKHKSDGQGFKDNAGSSNLEMRQVATTLNFRHLDSIIKPAKINVHPIHLSQPVSRAVF